MDSIHAHEVIHFIADTKRACSKAEWVMEINKKFGEAARFHNCSEQNLSAGELVDFITARGKFHVEGQALSIDASKICQH